MTRKRQAVQSRSPDAADCAGKVSSNSEGPIPRDSSYSLPLWEVFVYVAAILVIIAYLTWCVYRASIEYANRLETYNFDLGWEIFNRPKDISNFEWWFWPQRFMQGLGAFYVSHVFFSKLMDAFNVQYKLIFYLVHTIVSLLYFMGPVHVVLMTSHCLIHYIVATYTGSLLAVWMVIIATMTTLNYSFFTDFTKWLTPDDPFLDKFFLLNFTQAMIVMKCLSFSHEQCLQRKQGHKCFTMLDLFSYVFYLPLLLTGPHLTFHQFHTQYIHSAEKSLDRSAVLKHIWFACRLVFWCLFIEVYHHFMYTNAIMNDIDVMSKVSKWTVAGITYWQGMFFQIKYVVFFGLPSLLARLDHFEPPVKGPVCGAMVYRNSDLWRGFDRGLYEIIKRHIYVPIGGSRSGIWRQFIASFAAFAYIWYWHGGEMNLFFWVAYNFVGISCEAIGNIVMKSGSYVKLKEQHLSASWWFRIESLCALPVFILTALPLLYMFGGTETGHLIMYRLLLEDWPVSMICTVLSFYCSMQTTKFVMFLTRR